VKHRKDTRGPEGDQLCLDGAVADPALASVWQFVDQVNRLNKTLGLVRKHSESGSEKVLILLTDALKDMESLTVADSVAAIKSWQQRIRDRLNKALADRREVLHAEAKKAGMPSKRFSDYDRIGPFEVRYAGSKVEISLGTEVASEVVESDGKRLFSAIGAIRSQLESEPFDRNQFFQLLQKAYELTKVLVKHRDGLVPIRAFYTSVVMVKNLDRKDFSARPDAKHFHTYSHAQFVFDMARFCEAGTTCGKYRLRTETPGMNTVFQGHHMTLPSLKGTEGSGTPAAVLRIERTEE